MSIKLNVELEPFRTPNYVMVKQEVRQRQEGPCLDAPKYHVKDLDAETLGKLCDEFRASIFEKAGLKDNE